VIASVLIHGPVWTVALLLAVAALLVVGARRERASD